jgi:hypothetical protein
MTNDVILGPKHIRNKAASSPTATTGNLNNILNKAAIRVSTSLKSQLASNGDSSKKSYGKTINTINVAVKQNSSENKGAISVTPPLTTQLAIATKVTDRITIASATSGVRINKSNVLSNRHVSDTPSSVGINVSHKCARKLCDISLASTKSAKSKNVEEVELDGDSIDTEIADVQDKQLKEG